MSRGAGIVARLGGLLGAAPATVLLLIVAACASLVAWSLQASAAADLREAGGVQARETGGEGGQPPSAGQNRRIIETLDTSIEVRRLIDEQLQRIEASVAALSGSSADARGITEAALGEVRRIAAELGGAAKAARSSVGRLGKLQARLRASARLARLIAEELEELDRKMGPSAGGP